jgi:Rieske Fe-S protein
MAKSPHLSRNDFVKAAIGMIGTVIGGVIGLPAVGYLISPALGAQSSKETWIALGSIDQYPIGEPTLFTFTRSKINGWEKSVQSYGVFVVRKSDSEATVLSNVCTHLSCRVNWNVDKKEFDCPCHDAQFSIDGQVMYGPPPRPLDTFEAKIEEGLLSIRFVEG